MLMTLQMRLLIFSVLSTTLVSAMPTGSLFARQNTCPKSSSKCENSAFCCPNGTTCLSLAGNTTVLCCPEGSSCSKIETITCNVNELDPEKNPDAPVKTTVFNASLPRCGGEGCCPFGYSCSGKGQCEKDTDQSKPPATTSAVPTSTKAPASKTTSSATNQPSATTTTEAPTSTATSDESAGGKIESYGPDVGSIVGGVVGGCAVLLIAAVVIFICVRRRAQRNSTSSSEKPKSSGSGFSTIISDPIVQPNSYRTDFILRPSSNSTPGRSASGRSNRQSIACISEKRITRRSIRNPFNSPSLSYAGTVSRASSVSSEETPPRRGQVGARLAPIRTMKGSSKYLKPQRTSVHRQPSAESIDVFADPKFVDDKYARQTTFTELMDEADLSGVGRSRPYIPGTTPRI